MGLRTIYLRSVGVEVGDAPAMFVVVYVRPHASAMATRQDIHAYSLATREYVAGAVSVMVIVALGRHSGSESDQAGSDISKWNSDVHSRRLERL